jgi:L-lactate dehydrogenase complex protein LldG
MTSVTESRKQVLERICAATRGSAMPSSAAQAATAAEGRLEIPLDYLRQGKMALNARLELFVERLREYDAVVVQCRPEGLVAAIQSQLAASGRRTFVAPPGLPTEWLIDGFEWKIDRALPVEEIERAQGVVTECFCAVADSGTIVLHHGPAEGRRVITLLPDWHLCIVRASQIVETLPEYFDRCHVSGVRDQKAGTERLGTERTGTEGLGTRDLEAEAAKLPALVTWIAGPSATADIEMTRIKGVHGPRFLNVVVVNDGESGE